MKNTALADKIETVLVSRKGQFSRAAWSRACKTLKTCTATIIKTTVMTVRAGIEYDAMKAVKEARENGDLPAENAGLAWGSYDIYPYVRVNDAKDTRYAQLYPSRDINTHVVYHMDGVQVAYDDIVGVLYSKEKRNENGFVRCITVKMNDMVELY